MSLWFLLSPEQIGHLCIKGYGLSEGLVNNHDSPVDAAWDHFYAYNTHNPTGLIPMFRKNSRLLDEDLEGYILACRVAFVRPGLKEPDLSLDKASAACADYWFPPSLREMDGFKGVRYVHYPVPRRLGYPPSFIMNIYDSRTRNHNPLQPVGRAPRRRRWMNKANDGGALFILFEQTKAPGQANISAAPVFRDAREFARQGYAYYPDGSPYRSMRLAFASIW
ncbi:uncharacterized protein BXZ73DRAFT_101764 [Epithele typhae]|uniref:uncharacterized protein n=1 Tax=Epithele typhae TaxID=378194 RepID=UPI002008E0AE|nr:uncharacterized protein BXZ73DRAFT_101764 [Epithele typhae]KAH9931183.1 hypothetical protein BXZ73DRAFT_101764 [Epithele typhae]